MATKWKEVIAKLITKAEDPATPQAERDTLNDKVAYLMGKFSIEESMLKFNRHEEEPVITAKYKIPPPYTNKKRILMNGLVIAFGGRTVWSPKTETLHVFHFQDDQEKVFMLYNSLLIQMNTGVAEAQRFKPHGQHGKSFNASFIDGFVDIVVQRVREAVERAKHDVKSEFPGTDIMLADKSNKVAKAMFDAFPRLRSSNIYARSTSGDGYSAGRAAGSRADIGNTRIGSSRKSISG